MTAPISLTAKDVAQRLDTDPKTFRVFLRSAGIPKDEETSRYVFKAGDVAKLKKQFTAWQKERATKRAEAAKARAEAKAATPTPDLADAAETMSDEVEQ